MKNKKKIYSVIIIISICVIISSLYFVVSFVMFPTHMKEILIKSQIKDFKVDSHHSVSSRYVWGNLALKSEDLKKVVSYLDMKEIKLSPDLYDKFFLSQGNVIDKLTDEEMEIFLEGHYDIISMNMKELGNITGGKWNTEKLKGYSLYYLGGTPDKLRFNNGQNFTFLLIVIDEKRGCGIYLACYSFG